MYVERMQEVRNTYKILTGNLERKSIFGDFKPSWVEPVKIYVT
jgi:hypothetical protein